MAVSHMRMTPEENIIPHFTIMVSSLFDYIRGNNQMITKLHNQGEQVDLSPLAKELDLIQEASADP